LLFTLFHTTYWGYLDHVWKKDRRVDRSFLAFIVAFILSPVFGCVQVYLNYLKGKRK